MTTYSFRCVNGACDRMGVIVKKDYKVADITDAKPKCKECDSIMNRVYASIGVGTSDGFKRSL